MSKLPFVSIIVPVFNEEKYLDACLKSLKSQDYKPYEIIVVDNGSTDNSFLIAKKYTPHVFVLKPANIPALRNYGILHSKGSVIASIDADCVAAPDWLSNGVKLLDDKRLIAGHSYLPPLNSTWVQRTLLNSKRLADGYVKWVPSGNMFFTRKTFDSVSGFNELFTRHSDTDFCYRVGRVLSSSLLKVYHPGEPRTLFAFFKKEMRRGKGITQTLRFHFSLSVMRMLFLQIYHLIALISLPLYFFHTELLHVYFILLLLPSFLYSAYYALTSNILDFPLIFVLQFVYFIARSIGLFYRKEQNE